MSAPKQDIEVMINSVVGLIKNNLNARLTAIAAEKNDGITLPALDVNNAIAVISLNDKIMNYDPFVFIGVEDIQTEGFGPASSHEVQLSVVLIKSEDLNTTYMWQQMLRYMRAISEVIEQNFADLLCGGQIRIKNLAPKDITELNSSKQFRGTGISLSLPVSS